MERLTSSTATTLPKRLVTFSKRMMVLPVSAIRRPRRRCAATSVPCRRRATKVSSTVITIRMVEAALTSGVTEKRTIE